MDNKKSNFFNINFDVFFFLAIHLLEEDKTSNFVEEIKTDEIEAENEAKIEAEATTISPIFDEDDDTNFEAWTTWLYGGETLLFLPWKTWLCGGEDFAFPTIYWSCPWLKVDEEQDLSGQGSALVVHSEKPEYEYEYVYEYEYEDEEGETYLEWPDSKTCFGKSGHTMIEKRILRTFTIS